MTLHRLLLNPVIAAGLILLSPGAANAQCVVPDNGGGTVTLPPAGCSYLSPADVHRIVAGLAPGTTIELGAIHQDFICLRSGQQGCSFPTPVDCDQPGGALGGEQECAHSSLQLTLRGTGQLGGFMRNLNLPIDFETHVGPRTPGAPVQSFDTSMFRLFGQITGDPDFDLLRISGGSAFGMPSPGHTTLRQQGTSWAVDSFFDITYRIDFVGAPGGALAGRTGSTTGTIRMSTPAAPNQCLHGSLDCVDGNPCTNDHCALRTCVEPDSGAGTANLPPQGCGYVSPDDVHKIINGLPAGTTIEVGAQHAGFLGITRAPGGSLGGERENFNSGLNLRLAGTGGLAGYQRTLSVPIACETHVGPRTLGAPVQSFDTLMFAMQGQITGDPDFDLLRITGGNTFGMPSPGHTTLTRQPNGTWAVDSFFDITYRIDFVGRPGGPLGGMSGSTTATIRMTAGLGGVCANDPVDCGDADTCTVDYCDPSSGQCLHDALNCDDADPCTNDSCIPLPLEGTPPPECVVVGNGGGTVTLPPAGCQYLSPDDVHEIVAGLPPGTTVQLDAIHDGFACGGTAGTPNGVCSFNPPIPGVDCDEPGGTLGGEQECSDSTLKLDLSGTGTLSGYSRMIPMPISFETHTAPRTPGAPVQSFDTDMFRLFGQMIGDPDFDLLRIVAGTDFGLPSPGHTTLTQQAGGMWAVDSFFDITYRIDFVGAAGGPLAGRSGSTTGTIRMATGSPCSHTPACDDGNPCTIDSCDPTNGQCSYAPIDCSDGNPCTIDSCTAAQGCVHQPVDCDDQNACTEDFCNPLLEGTPGNPCNVPDNGGGTVTLPPAGCEYLSPTEVHEIIDGLPAGTTIELGTIHKDFICHDQPGGSGVCSFTNPPPGADCDQPGGALGGEKECADSTLDMMLHGTGTLAGFDRPISVPISFETHVAPRTPGAPVQSFDTQMFRLFGQIIGDPDFDLLRIVAGNDFGLPSPGHTTLTQTGASWAVDSFFDITYRIDFVGAAGSPLAGRSGSTTGTIRMSTGGAPCLHAPIVCNDNNPCTLDSCDPGTGCVYSLVDCSDEDECTADSCVAATGECIHEPLNCNDNNPCTTDSCNPTEGTSTDPCVVNDNGGGTVTLPPAGCAYLGPDDVHRIIDGLPAGTTIAVAPIHKDFICGRTPGAVGVCSFVPPVPGVDCDQPGGTLGGEQECAESNLGLHLSGTGALAGFDRTITLPISFETHVAPRTPGNPVQSFDTDMFRLFGQITGDPDFDLLRIVAGTDFALPSPGHTTLTQLPGGTWAVDSFFDITYRIDFVGAAGGPLAGHSGSTTATIRMAAGGNPCTNQPIDCNDNNACTNDFCDTATGGCVHPPVNCDDSNACTADSCSAAIGCANLPIICVDGNNCTLDSCDTAAGCVFTPLIAPGDVAPLEHAPDKSKISWPPDPNATSYDIVRGRVSLLPVGPGGGDEVCLGPAGAPTVNDPAIPASGVTAFYVVRAKNQTCPSASGYGRTHSNPGGPLNGPPRNTTTCP